MSDFMASLAKPEHIKSVLFGIAFVVMRFRFADFSAAGTTKRADHFTAPKRITHSAPGGIMRPFNGIHCPSFITVPLRKVHFRPFIPLFLIILGIFVGTIFAFCLIVSFSFVKIREWLDGLANVASSGYKGFGHSVLFNRTLCLGSRAFTSAGAFSILARSSI